MTDAVNHPPPSLQDLLDPALRLLFAEMVGLTTIFAPTALLPSGTPKTLGVDEDLAFDNMPV